MAKGTSPWWRRAFASTDPGILAFAGSLPLAAGMTRHLRSLMAGVQRIARGDLSTRIPVRSRDEFGELAGAFNRMAEDLATHQKLIVEQERLRRELELCRQIQPGILPCEPLRLGVAEVKGVSIPAREGGRRLLQLLRPALTWYGRGPFETYGDRNTAADVGLYGGSVAEEYVAYVRPQENGHKLPLQLPHPPLPRRPAGRRRAGPAEVRPAGQRQPAVTGA